MLVVNKSNIAPEIPAGDSHYSTELRQLFQSPRNGDDEYAGSSPILEGLVLAADLVLLVSAAAVLAAWRTDSTAATHQYLLAMLVAAAITLFFLARGQAYRLRLLRSATTQVQLIGASLLLGYAGGALSAHLLRPEEPLYGSPALARWLLAAAVLLPLSRLVLQQAIRSRMLAGRLTRSVAVVGVPELVRSVAVRAAARPDLRVVGLYADSTAWPRHAGSDMQGGTRDLIERCRQARVDAIVIAVPLSEPERIRELCRQLQVTVADVYLMPDVAGLGVPAVGLVDFGGSHAILMHERPLKDWSALQKRVFDVVLSTLLLVVLAVPMAAVALLVRCDSPGPVLFRQPRVGFNNQLFGVYKFRTMYHHMADLLADQQTTRDDKRITRTGKWLRRLSIDELPQLFNVLAGQMSLVGPRPHAPNTKAGDHRFDEIVAEYALRHWVKPGITGWAQVNGWRGETRTLEQIEQRVACDLYYIDNWSLLFDAKILLLTVVREIASTQAF